MNSTANTKELQLKNILYALKLLSILFSAIPIYQYLFRDDSVTTVFESNFLTTPIMALLVIMAIFVLVIVVSYNTQKSNPIQSFAEIAMFFLLFLAAILVSGVNASYYKFIFVFLIVSCTIEYSMKVGLIVAFTSSMLLLTIDFVTQLSNTNIYLENDLALSAMFVIISFILGLYSQLQEQHITLLKTMAHTDGLTQIYNHLYFYQALAEKCSIAIQENTPLCLIMLDIDYFKNYNDIYGHQKGDAVLKTLVSILEKELSDVENILCRYGGEEFSIILPGTSLDKAYEYGNRLRSAVEKYEFEGENVLPDKCLTISLGVAQLKPEEHFNDLVKRTDHALYRAKYLRRNRVEAYTSVIEEYYHASEDSSDGHIDMTPLKTLIVVINSKDSYTYNHTERVVNYCDIFARHLQLDNSKRKLLIYAAYLHDLGKINIEKEILVTSERLTNEQWSILKTHPTEGANLVRQVGISEDIARIIEQHHERFDGNGYPNGLYGDQIEFLARVLAVVDSFDAMTNNRPYNKRKTFEEAFKELRACSGTQFDPSLTGEFITAMKNV